MVRFGIVAWVCLLVTLTDLLTKSWVFWWLGGPGERPVWWIIEGVLGFQTTLNEGAVFGIGQGFSTFFAVMGVIALGLFLAWFFWAAPKDDTWIAVAVGAVLGGIVGNLYDRLGLHGLRWQEPWIGARPYQVGDPVYAVRDFILVMIGPYPWPNFNVADSALVCAIAGLILRLWAIERKLASKNQVEVPAESVRG